MNNLDLELFEQLRILLDENFDLLIDTFISDNMERIKELESVIEDGRWVDVRQISHAMKSSSSNIGAIALSQLCQQIESDSVNNFDDVKTKYDRLCTEFDAVVLCLNNNR